MSNGARDRHEDFGAESAGTGELAFKVKRYL